MLFVVLLFASVAFVVAQQNAQPNSSSSSSQTDPRPSTVKGCLAGADGNFTLASQSGTTFQLVGDAAQLSKLAGMEVSVTGMKGSASDISTGQSGYTGLSTSNPTAGTAPMIRVKHAKKIADTCAK